MRRVAITGTRDTGHRGEGDYERLFERYLAPFAFDAHFYVGGAVGIDTLCLLWLARATTARITVVVPGTVSQQPAAARRAVTVAAHRVGELVELGAAPLHSPAYHARNRWMVDRAELTVGFPHGTKPSSGTWQTLDYTAASGKPRLIVPV
ncbi:hypothetical protein ABT160_44645 [Streptomyces sp. NPDC001941]|uniref:hypothetical protein n=1 Tax=Streptomyces sp. NPDC001941 TaxID=3154659 RepID=UPI00331D417D